MDKDYVVAVDLGGTKIYTALVDLKGNIIKEKIVSTEANKGDIAIVSNIKKTIDRDWIARTFRCKKRVNCGTT